VITADVPDGQKPVQKEEGEPIWVKMDDLGRYELFEDVGKIIRLVNDTPEEKLFHARTEFKDKKMITFEVN